MSCGREKLAEAYEYGGDVETGEPAAYPGSDFMPFVGNEVALRCRQHQLAAAQALRDEHHWHDPVPLLGGD